MQRLSLSRCRSRRIAATLVELLVVMAIIGVLVALILPAVQMAREAARRTQCANHLRQIGQGLQLHHDARGFLPQTRTVCYYGTWATELLPYIEQRPLADRRDPQLSYFFQPLDAIQGQVPIYYCRSRRGPQLSIDGDNKEGADIAHRAGALSDYAVVAGDGSTSDHRFEEANGPFVANTAVEWPYCLGSTPELRFRGQYGPSVRFAMITDGLSNTLFVGEKHVPRGQFGHSDSGDNCVYNGDHVDAVARFGGLKHPLAKGPAEPAGRILGSYHPGICQFVFGDGRVVPLASTIDLTVLGRLCNRYDGEPIPAGAF